MPIGLAVGGREFQLLGGNIRPSRPKILHEFLQARTGVSVLACPTLHSAGINDYMGGQKSGRYKFFYFHRRK